MRVFVRDRFWPEGFTSDYPRLKFQTSKPFSYVQNTLEKTKTQLLKPSSLFGLMKEFVYLQVKFSVHGSPRKLFPALHPNYVCRLVKQLCFQAKAQTKNFINKFLSTLHPTSTITNKLTYFLIQNHTILLINRSIVNNSNSLTHHKR